MNFIKPNITSFSEDDFVEFLRAAACGSNNQIHLWKKKDRRKNKKQN